MKPKRHLLIGFALVTLLAALATGQMRLEQAAAAQAKAAVQAPRFEVDPMWPKPLPNHWLLGSTIGVSVDAQDHVWIIHRSSATLNNNERGAELDPPTGECCKGAPPVLEFDQAGNLLRHWGGPGQGFEWPQSNHGITIDYKGNVWIGGNGADDGQVLKFTQDGKFIKQFGMEWGSAGSNDTWAFGQVAKIFVDKQANEAYISDGYRNHRVAVIDADSGQFKRLWGAYVIERQSLQLLTSFGDGGRQPGQFFGAHSIATDSKGNIYITETYEGKRVQRFVYKGLGPVTKENQGVVWPTRTSSH